MTDRELMQMALDALESWQKTCLDCGRASDELGRATKPLQTLRARLAQPEPDDGYCQACDGNHCTAKNECVALDNPKAQPEPEPVAWLYMVGEFKHVHGKQIDHYYSLDNGETRIKGIPLYTAPPQREWQGLTDEEVEALDCTTVNACDWNEYEVYKPSVQEFARAIEAKLKEKNDG